MTHVGSIITKIFVRVKAVISNDFNIQALRDKYGAHGDTIVRVDVFEDRARTRKVYSAQYKVTDEGIKEVDPHEEPNAISQTDYQTILNLIKGTRTWDYQGRKYVENYNYIRAFAEGRITVTKVKDLDGYLADMGLFEELYQSILPKLNDTIGKYL